MAEPMITFDGFCFGVERFDPVARHHLLRRLDFMPPHMLEDKTHIMYHNAFILLIAAYSAKDLLKAGRSPNIPFFVTVGRQFGCNDTNALRYLFRRFISGREMFYANNIPGKSDGFALEHPDIRFTHKTFCLVFNDLKRRMWSSEARAAARDQIARLARDVAKTMVQFDLLRDFTDVTTLLDTQTISHARLAKKIARAMIERNLLKVVWDLVIMLDKKTTQAIRNRLSQIYTCTELWLAFCRGITELYYQPSQGGAKLEEAIKNVEFWDINAGADTYYHHLEYNTHLTGRAEAVRLNEDVLYDWESDRTCVTGEGYGGMTGLSIEIILIMDVFTLLKILTVLAALLD
ncbi:hypothetical protein F4679DRAFT_589666 [Xylaria curta]|nr:hypothetical protein F4679DRAFT_589666 [Xylaria curta]